MTSTELTTTELEERLTERQKRYCELIAFEGKTPEQARRRAGYKSESPTYSKAVQAYLSLLTHSRLQHGAIGAIEELLAMLRDKEIAPELRYRIAMDLLSVSGNRVNTGVKDSSGVSISFDLAED